MAAAKDGNGGRIWDIAWRIITTVGVICLPIIIFQSQMLYNRIGALEDRIGALEVGQAEIKVELRLADDKSDDIDDLTRAVHALELAIAELKQSQS